MKTTLLATLTLAALLAGGCGSDKAACDDGKGDKACCKAEKSADTRSMKDDMKTDMKTGDTMKSDTAKKMNSSTATTR